MKPLSTGASKRHSEFTCPRRPARPLSAVFIVRLTAQTDIFVFPTGQEPLQGKATCERFLPPPALARLAQSEKTDGPCFSGRQPHQPGSNGDCRFQQRYSVPLAFTSGIVRTLSPLENMTPHTSFETVQREPYECTDAVPITQHLVLSTHSGMSHL